MQWIWMDENTAPVNTYAWFRQSFTCSGGNVTLRISVADEYAVFVNDVFVDCGQYDDYPQLKYYDTLDLTPWCRPGENELRIGAYYQGAPSFQCIPSAPKLWFQVEGADAPCESGSETQCKPFLAYANGPCEEVSGQYSFTFHYDAGKEEEGQWQPATCVAYDMLCLPRPIKKLRIHPPTVSSIQVQGVYLSDRTGTFQTAAQRVNADLLAPRRAEGMMEYVPQSKKTYGGSQLSLPGEYRISTPEGFDGTYVLVDLGCEQAGFVHLELEAESGTVFEIGYGEHLEDGRVRAEINGRNFAFSYTAGSGCRKFTHWYKRIACRYLELHARTDKPFTLKHLTVLHTEYPLTVLPYPEGLTDTLARKIYDISVETLKLCMHEHYEDCPWREQALYAMDSRNQALAGYYAFGEYEFPKANWQLFEPGLRPDGMFPLTVPSVDPRTIPVFNLVWVIACQELVSYGGEIYNIFLPTMRKVLDAFTARLSGGVLASLEGEEYWNFYEWVDGLAGTLGDSEDPQKSAPLTLFYYAALRSYRMVCDDGRYTEAEAAVGANFHNTFWDPEAEAYRTFENAAHFAELVQALALWCGLVPEGLASRLRKRLADLENPWAKVTLSHYIYKMDALMMEPEVYYSVAHRDIMERWGKMVFCGATSFWETEAGSNAFGKASSLCHGWSAIPVYFWHKYNQYR